MANRKQKLRPASRDRRPTRPEIDERLALVDGTAVWGAAPPPLLVRAGLPALIAVCAFVTYWPALSAGFVNWDDDKTIVENPRVRGFHWNWAFTQSKMGHYHPLTWLSYGVDHAIGAWRYPQLDAEAQERYEAGLDPRIFHVFNLLLHAGVAVAFYFLARLILRLVLPPPQGQPDVLTALAAGLAALLFACHPLRVENAVWVTERRDVLSAIFLLPSLHCYLRYALAPRKGAARLAWYLGALVLLTLSLLSKAWGITLPAVMLLLDYHPLRRMGREAGWTSARAQRALLEKIPFVALAAFFAYQAKKAQAAQLATMKSLAEWGVADRVLQAFYGLFLYSWKTLVPVGLTPLRPLPPVRVTDLSDSTSPVVREIVLRFLTSSLLAAFVVVVAVILLINLRKRWPSGVVLGLIYAGTLSPILGFAQSGPQLVADKYAYIGCLVWPLAAAAGLIVLWRRRERASWARSAAPLAIGLAVALGATYAVLAYRQSRFWIDSHALWSRAVQVDPHCVLARTNLGMLERQAGRIDTALAHYEAAIEVDPTDVILLNNYAHALRQDPARLDQAIGIMRRAVKFQPKMPDLHFTLANALIDAGQVDEAEAELHECVRLKWSQPHPKYHRALGKIYLARGDLDAAQREYERALELELLLDPRGAGVINAYDQLGWIMLQRGQREAAIGWYQRILEIDPDNAGARRGIAKARQQGG